MLCRRIICRSYINIRNPVLIRSASSEINIEKLELESTANINVIDNEAVKREEEIELKRNKSRLREQDRNFLFESNPYPSEPQQWQQGTVKYLRRLYGRYGEASGVNSSICWPSKQELADIKEYEKVAYPYKILEVAEECKRNKELRKIEILKQQEDILSKLSKLEGWKKDLQMRIEKKESDAKAARDRKERLIEEVRRHFGYTVDPRDERFKEMLEKKEKEQKKAMKEARKKMKEEKMVEKLLAKKKDNVNQIVKD